MAEKEAVNGEVADEEKTLRLDQDVVPPSKDAGDTGSDSNRTGSQYPVDSTALSGVASDREGLTGQLDVERTGSHAVQYTDDFEVGWDGDDDPRSPRSLSLFHKWIIVVIIAMSSLCVTCASSIYSTVYDQMKPRFGISNEIATLGLSTFNLGLALGPLVLSPLSEFYGRRPIYLGAMAMFLIWTIPCAVAQNAQTMIVARFFSGFAGSALLGVAGGTVHDLFTKESLGLPMSVTAVAPFAGPSLGPLIGGFINSYASFRWTFYFLLILSGASLISLVFLVPETYHPIKLRDKARWLRKETGEQRWKAPMEKTNKSVVRTVAYSLLRPFQLLIFEPMCFLLSLFSAILLGILYLFFGGFPLIFGDVYGFNLWQTGIAFLGILIGMVTSSAIDPFFHRYQLKLEKRNGRAEPEYHLIHAMPGSVSVTVGLFMFAWTAYPSVHWIVPIIGSAFFGLGTGLVFTGVFTFLVDCYPLYAASAMGANTFLRNIFAAAYPLFGIQMYDGLGFHWANTLLALLTVAMMPFPVLFFIYGKRLRRHSRFASASE